MFFYAQTFIDIDLIEPHIQILEELDRKQRKIRSLRGFFLYAFETMENGKTFEILTTNLKPSFWRNLKTILRQNKKAVLLQFLFGFQDDKIDPTPVIDLTKGLKEKVQKLQEQVSFLQERVIELETQKTKNLLSEATLRGLDASLTSEQSDSTLNQYKAENEPKFVTLSKISEEDRREIIQTVFQRNQEGKISLKKYYQSTDPNSLFQLKGYSIKYKSVRWTRLYQQLKP